MSERKIPLVILGGGGRQPAELPPGAEGRHVLTGYKAMDLVILGRPLILHLADRLAAVEAFEPIFLAGPARIYDGVCPQLSLIDTDGSFGQNIAAAIAGVRRRVKEGPVAFTTCDVLPKAEEVHVLLEDYFRHAPLDFWMPQIRVPADDSLLGESRWKPRYRLVPDGEAEAVDTLPGHLVIADLEALRLPLIYRIFQLSYETRNRSVAYRKAVIARRLMAWLWAEDFRRILRARWPGLTWDVIVNGLAVARGLPSGTMSARDLALRVGRAYVARRHRRSHPRSRGRMPVLPGLSLAKDIDTEEEAREMEQILRKETRPQ